MAVTADTSAVASGTSIITVTLSAGAMTLNASANLLLLFAGWGLSPIATSDFVGATVNGVSIFANKFYTTKTDGNFEGVGCVYQKSPATGSSPAYVITYKATGVQQGVIIAASFIGADVAGTTFGTEITGSANNSSGTIGPFSSVSGDLIVGNIASDANATITESDSLIREVQAVGSPADSCFGAQYSATVNDTLTWACSSPDTGWAAGGNVIKSTGGASPDTPSVTDALTIGESATPNLRSFINVTE